MSRDTFTQIISGQGVLNSSVVVEWREGGRVRSEATRLMNVDQHGATFMLRERPELGQLVRVMPELYAYTGRAADGGAGGFWALVWAVSEVGAAGAGGATRHVASVLFFGDDVAGGLGEDRESDFSYVVEEEGVFRLQRMLRPEVLVVEPEDRRREPRIYRPFEVSAEVVDRDGRVIRTEPAVTENVSRSGAALRTRLVVPPEWRLRLTCRRTGFTVNSVVRACRVGADNLRRVHVEFTDGRWPLDEG